MVKRIKVPAGNGAYRIFEPGSCGIIGEEQKEENTIAEIGTSLDTNGDIHSYVMMNSKRRMICKVYLTGLIVEYMR